MQRRPRSIAAERRLVGGVDDGVDRQGGDVGTQDFDHGSLALCKPTMLIRVKTQRKGAQFCQEQNWTHFSAPKGCAPRAVRIKDAKVRIVESKKIEIPGFRRPPE